jgi:cob(I)alamin adenosyltransferase
MIVVFTGNGKGKTTAALGAAVRAVGRGQKVLMVQFIKGPWQSGEDFVTITKNQGPRTKNEEQASSNSSVLSPSFTLKKMGLGFVGILGDQLPREEHEKAAQKTLAYIEEQLPQFDMVIMDEVNVAVSLKLITAQAVLDVLKDLPAEKIVLLTGRGAPQEFIDAADLVTEMKEVKHPFNSGKIGKLNVEF